MALAQVSNQLLRSQGNDTTTVATNYPITGDGSTQLPLGLAEDYRGADGTSVTFEISAIENGHRVTLSGAQGQESFDVLNGTNGTDGADGQDGAPGADGQSVTFDITNITNGHQVTLSGVQGSSSFNVMNGENGVDGVSPTFRFEENEEGVTVYVSGAQGESAFNLYNALAGSAYSAGDNIDITDFVISGKNWLPEIESAISSVSGDYYPMTGNPSGFVVSSYLSSYYQKNETSSKDELSAAFDAIPEITAYSAGDNIDITNFVISGKDWSTDISNAATAGSAAATAWVSEQNYLTEHQDVSNLPYVQNSALEYTQNQFISAISGNELYSVSAENAFTAETAHFVDGGWELTNDGDISGYNGSAFVGQGGSVDPSALSAYIPKSAAQNVSNVHYSYAKLANDPNQQEYLNVYNVKNDIVSAFDTTWNNCSLVLSNLDINGACPIKFTVTADASADALYVTAADAAYNPILDRITLTPINAGKTIFSAEFKDKETSVHLGTDIYILQFSRPAGAISMTASITSCNDDVFATQPWVENKFNAFTAGADITEYSAGDNINITNHVVSGKDWSNTITAASSYAYNEATAKDHTYTGVSPIVVNNTEDKISANCIELSAGNGIDSVKLATGVIECSGNAIPAYYASTATITFEKVAETLGASGVVFPYDAWPNSRQVYNYYGSAAANNLSSFTFKKYQANGYEKTLLVYDDNGTTGVSAESIKVWATPQEAECKVVLVSTSGDIPASGATDGKLYVVTGT